MAGGKRLHADAVAAGYHTNEYVASALVSMYRKCGSMSLAREIFETMTHKSVVTWTCLVSGYVENGESQAAFELFTRMDCAPDHVAYIAVLKALATERKVEKKALLQKGIAIHTQIKERGFDTDIAVANTLIDMYGKCGGMQLAQEVFDSLVRKDVVTWNSLILGYVGNGESSLAIELFRTIDCEPDRVTYIAALKACANGKEMFLSTAIGIHKHIRDRGLDSNLLVASTLLDMYSKCRSMQRAQEVFDRMTLKDVVTWTCLIMGYVENGENSLAMDLFTRMELEPNAFTYVAALKACTGLSMERESAKHIFLEKGIAMHKELKARGFHSDIVVTNALVDMYGKYGCMHRARAVFDSATRRDVITWTCLIRGYMENGESSVALELFTRMDCEPNRVTYVAALNACASLVSERKSEKQTVLQKGINIHQQAKDHGYDSDVVVGTTLLDMYSKCGSMCHSQQVFQSIVQKDVATWNCLLLGYVENGESSVSLELFTTMDCKPDRLTYVAVLKACASLASERPTKKQAFLEKGIGIHREAGDDSDIVLATTLVDMYSKCGSIERSREVFDRITHPNVITWNCLILGYVENGESSLALDLFGNMDCEPDNGTYVAILKACGSLTAVQVGKLLHGTVCRLGLEQDEAVATALVSFYGKCGIMFTAEELFNSIHSPSLVSWTALITGYTSLGECSQVLMLLKKIQEAGLQLDGVTYMCVLTACSHSGMVDEGLKSFKSMYRYGIHPSVEHYSCIVDMLGRANRLEEALLIVYSMPCVPDAVMWTSLLGACWKWKNLKVGKVAYDALVAYRTQDAAAAYVLMSDILQGQ